MKQVETLRKPKSFSPLRWQREMRGWSLDRVAEELDKLGGGCDSKRIGKWELGKVKPSPFYREKLCLLYSVSADQLGFTDTQREPQQAALAGQAECIHQHDNHLAHAYSGRSAAIGSEDMFSRKRRELLQLLSIAATTLVIPVPDVDWDRFQRAAEKPHSLDQQVIQDLLTINRHYWSIYRAAPNKEAVLDGVFGQLKTLTQFLRENHPVPQHRQLCELASDLSQLVGECFFDTNHYDAAQACYVFAANAAKDAGHYDLWACALVRHAFLPIYEASIQEASFQEALPLLQGAKNIAHRGDTSLATRFWVANVSAQAHAGVKDLVACQKDLDFAEEVRSSGNGANGMWLRFDDTRLAEEKGSCFVKLGRPDLAMPALNEALKQHPDATRRRGMVLTDLALSALQLGEPALACAYASEVAQIAQKKGSGMLLKGLQSLQIKLTPYQKSRFVQELKQQIAVLS